MERKAMWFQAPLQKGTLIKRYKRFLADIELVSGKVITAHCPNSGSMLGLKEPGLPVCVSVASNPKRKLPYTLEMVKIQETWVGINTNWPNKLVAEGFYEQSFSDFSGYQNLRAEVKYGENTRLDFLLTRENGAKAYVEVKNVTLKKGRQALFPDAVTIRGAKHLETLIQVVNSGHRAFLVFIVQRDDCEQVAPATHIDPHYSALLKQAVKKGVTCLCYQYTVTPEGIFLKRKMSLEVEK
jgi:sugar fermentation stimulation protein A